MRSARYTGGANVRKHRATSGGIERQAPAVAAHSVRRQTFEIAGRMAGFEPAASCSQTSSSQSPDRAPCRSARRSAGVMLAGRRQTQLGDCACWLPNSAPVQERTKRAVQVRAGSPEDVQTGRDSRDGGRRLGRMIHLGSASRCALRADRCRYSNGSTRRSFGRPADSLDWITSARSATTTSTSPTRRRWALTASCA
jgi:hypothetical protein